MMAQLLEFGRGNGDTNGWFGTGSLSHPESAIQDSCPRELK